MKLNAFLALVCAVALASCSEGEGDSRKLGQDARAAKSSSPTENNAASVPTATYNLPPNDVKSLITSVSATRTSEGTVIVSGRTLLPPGTKLWIDQRTSSRKKGERIDVVIDGSGGFSTTPFLVDGKAPNAGSNRIGVFSHFNSAWQPKAVLAITGEGGINLPPATLTPNDPEFPTEGGHLDETITVLVPEMPSDLIAIEGVKSAKLYVKGDGQAVDTVGEVVDYFGTFPGVNPLRWSADEEEGLWVVTLDYEDGATKKMAQWSFDPKSRKVKYLDSRAKMFSWLPAD